MAGIKRVCIQMIGGIRWGINMIDIKMIRDRQIHSGTSRESLGSSLSFWEDLLDDFLF